ADVLFNERRQVDVLPRLVRTSATRHEDKPRYDSRDLNNGVQRLATTARLRAHQQIVAPVQQMREWMTGVHGKRGQHWENFLLKVTICPGSAFRRQLRDFAHVNPVLCQLGQQLVFPSVYSVPTSSRTVF